MRNHQTDRPRGERAELRADGLPERIEGMMRSGRPFAAVEHEIDAMELPRNQKAALWLLSWSLRDRGTQLRDARELVTLVRAAPTG